MIPHTHLLVSSTQHVTCPQLLCFQPRGDLLVSTVLPTPETGEGSVRDPSSQKASESVAAALLSTEEYVSPSLFAYPCPLLTQWLKISAHFKPYVTPCVIACSALESLYLSPVTVPPPPRLFPLNEREQKWMQPPLVEHELLWDHQTSESDSTGKRLSQKADVDTQPGIQLDWVSQGEISAAFRLGMIICSGDNTAL